MKVKLFVLIAVLLALLAPAARADDGGATHYYVSLGDSLAASFQPNGDFEHGYAEQLYATLSAADPKLKLVKLGCGGESTASMRFGSQVPSVVLSCGTPRYYKNVLYPKGTQLAERQQSASRGRSRKPTGARRCWQQGTRPADEEPGAPAHRRGQEDEEPATSRELPAP
jgi:hypothetical protein